MNEFDILNFLQANDVKFKGPNRRGYLEVEECPFCGGKYKLNVFISKLDSKIRYGFAKCFKCGEPGSFHRYMANRLNISESEALTLFQGKSAKKEGVSPFAVENTYSLEISNKRIHQELSISKMAKVLLPVGDFPDEECLKYLSKRGMTIEEFERLGCIYVPRDLNKVMSALSRCFHEELEIIKKQGLYFDFKNLIFKKDVRIKDGVLEKINEINPQIIDRFKETLRLRGRVVFPVKIGSKDLAFVARDITGLSKVKAINSTGPWANSLFWNFNSVRSSKEIIICEGIFSAISCGTERSIALLGKNISKDSEKIRLLKTLKPEVFYIYLDTGAEKDAEDLRKVIAAFADQVYIVRPPSALKLKRNLSEKELNLIRSKGLNISSWEKESTYLLDYREYRSVKVALRLKSNKIIPKIDLPHVQFAKKIIGLDDDLLDLLANGDYLDANDLGRSYNDKLITECSLFRCD